MRARLILVLALAVLLVSCGDDDGVTTTSTTAGTTSGPASTTTTGEISTTSVAGGQSGWARVPHDDAVFGVVDPSWMWARAYGVTAGGPGVVAVGDRFPSIDYGDRPGVWTSPEGIGWTAVPHDEAVFGGGELGVPGGGGGGAAGPGGGRNAVPG